MNYPETRTAGGTRHKKEEKQNKNDNIGYKTQNEEKQNKIKNTTQKRGAIMSQYKKILG